MIWLIAKKDFLLNLLSLLKFPHPGHVSFQISQVYYRVCALPPGDPVYDHRQCGQLREPGSRL